MFGREGYGKSMKTNCYRNTKVYFKISVCLFQVSISTTSLQLICYILVFDPLTHYTIYKQTRVAAESY